MLAGDEGCQEHWKVQSALAGNPDVSNIVVSKPSVSTSVFIEILHCLSKVSISHSSCACVCVTIILSCIKHTNPGKLLKIISPFMCPS